MKHALILCSGGLDSVTLTYYLKKLLGNVKLTIIFFNYNQNAVEYERTATRACAKAVKANYREIKIADIPEISINALPHLATTSLKDTSKESAHWYIPFRNGLFIAYAAALAEKISLASKAKVAIFTGFKHEGKEPFPDATQEFVVNYNSLLKTSTKSRPQVHAPFIAKDKEDIVLLAKKLNVPLENTYSCYLGGKKHCGTCLACRMRKSGFKWANVPDSTVYASQ